MMGIHGRVRRVRQSKWLDISALGAPGPGPQMNERGCEGVCFQGLIHWATLILSQMNERGSPTYLLLTLYESDVLNKFKRLVHPQATFVQDLNGKLLAFGSLAL